MCIFAMLAILRTYRTDNPWIWIGVKKKHTEILTLKLVDITSLRMIVQSYVSVCTYINIFNVTWILMCHIRLTLNLNSYRS